MNKKYGPILVTLASIAMVLACLFIFNLSGVKYDGSTLRPQDIKKIPEETNVIHALVCGVDLSQKLTDVIMYVQYNPKDSTAKILSIPRDTFIGTEFDSSGKINSVYKNSGSFDKLMEVIERQFHLPVDYYASITLDSLGKIVDEIGGVEITISSPLYEGDTLMFDSGTQTLTGEQAAMFVRLRHAYVNADLGRIEAQHNFLISLMRKLQSMGKLKMLQLIMSNYDAVTTDMPLSKIMSVAATAFSINQDSIQAFTVPGTGKMNGSYAVYEVDKDGLCDILNNHFLSKGITADALDFPIVTAAPRNDTENSKEPENEQQDEEPIQESESSSEESHSGEPIYPDPTEYDEDVDGDYAEWVKRNTIYPDEE